MGTASALFSVIDIGSNSVRMVIYDTSSVPAAQIYNEKVFCALGRDIARTGRLNPEGVEAALDGLRHYAQEAKRHNLVHLDIVGTAALRDAADGHEFIERCREETGLSIRLIDGHQEARYAALGVMALDPAADGLVADFGGGSLEFARVKNGKAEHTISKPYGAFRVLAMEAEAEKILQEGLRAMGSMYRDAPALYSIGGSWRSLAQAHMMDLGIEKPLQGFSIDRDVMILFCDKIINMSAEDARTAYNLEEKRAALAGISAFVLRQVLTALRPARMIVSQAGIRDGILYDFYNR